MSSFDAIMANNGNLTSLQIRENVEPLVSDGSCIGYPRPAVVVNKEVQVIMILF